MLVLQRPQGGRRFPEDTPVYLDKSMATAATTLYQKYRRLRCARRAREANTVA